MQNPVSASSFPGYPAADSSAANNRTFWGGVVPSVGAPAPYRGGVTFGTLSLSEPNTSPDVITAAAVLHPAHFKDGVNELNVPGGTPVCIAPDGFDSRGEPKHVLVAAPFPSSADVSPSKDATGSYTLHPNAMCTVLVGPARFRRGVVAYAALAVQNVATVVSHKKSAGRVGDAMYISVRATEGTCPDVYADLRPGDVAARRIIPVTPWGVYGTRCDVGAPCWPAAV